MTNDASPFAVSVKNGSQARSTFSYHNNIWKVHILKNGKNLYILQVGLAPPVKGVDMKINNCKKVIKTIAFYTVVIICIAILWQQAHLPYERTEYQKIAENDTEKEQGSVSFPEEYKKTVNDSFAFDAKIITGENIDYENLYASTASIVYPDADKWKTMFLKDNLNYEESCFETESRNGDRLNAEVYDNELEGFLRLDAEQGLYWKEPLMRYLVQVLHMNGEYGAEDPMDNEAVFRDADDLSGFDRTQAWESACEQMNQLGIEEGNLQYKESYCMHIEDLEEQTQRLLKDGSLSAQDAKESWSKDEEGYLFYFSQTLQGIEIFRYENIRDYPGMYGDMQVYVMKDGLGELQIPVLYSCKLEKKKLSLVSFDKIAEVLEKNYGSVITEEPITVRKCQLVMYPLQKKNGVYDMVPVWICQIGKYQGEGRNESYNYIPINAVTGEEMVELEVE